MNRRARVGRGAVIVAAMALLMTPLAGCFSAVCDCANDPGLLVMTGAPITEVALSGAACAGASFRCVPAAFDNTVHPDCTQLQVLPHAEGECVVDLMTAGGPGFTVRRQFVAAPSGGCCGGGFTEAHHEGYVDLRNLADAGSD